MRGLISARPSPIGGEQFSELALELFALQFQNNSAYQAICTARKATPQSITHWSQIPAVPTSAFKDLELTAIVPSERTAVFHSSGTTEQKPSRHFHCPESLAGYETALWPWFAENIWTDPRLTPPYIRLVCLTPPPAQVPHSSLVHMFEIVRKKLGATKSAFVGNLAPDSSWTLDFFTLIEAIAPKVPPPNPLPLLVLGTAFSFVHLLDFLAGENSRLTLPAGSRVLETGGYKNRSRSLPKAELHALITERLGVPRENIICEYGMSELSSQAYDTVPGVAGNLTEPPTSSPQPAARFFRFPPWARAQIISPENGNEVAEGETGLIRIFDLANVFSVAAIQTEDLGIRRGEGFELIGRAQRAEARGCSLMNS